MYQVRFPPNIICNRDVTPQRNRKWFPSERPPTRPQLIMPSKRQTKRKPDSHRCDSPEKKFRITANIGSIYLVNSLAGATAADQARSGNSFAVVYAGGGRIKRPYFQPWGLETAP